MSFVTENIPQSPRMAQEKYGMYEYVQYECYFSLCISSSQENLRKLAKNED